MNRPAPAATRAKLPGVVRPALDQVLNTVAAEAKKK